MSIPFIDSRSSDEIPWRKSTFADGAEVKDLGKTGGYTMQLVRFKPYTSFPPHDHAGPEFIFVLEGEVIQNGKKLGAGFSSVAATATRDYEFRTESGCMFLLVYNE